MAADAATMVLDCPECKAKGIEQTFTGPTAAMQRGLHRRREHGVTGQRPKKSDGTRRDRPPRVAGEKKAPSVRTSTRRTFKVAGTLIGVVDPYCGMILKDHSQAFADALAELAETEPWLMRLLRGAGKGGKYAALIAASAEIAVPILAHHRMVPPELPAFVGAPLPPMIRRPESEQPPNGQTPAQ